jgi:hypothetical protein
LQKKISRKQWILWGGIGYLSIELFQTFHLLYVREEFLYYVFAALSVGLAYHHSSIDTVIWKFRKDPDNQKQLDVAIK